MKPASNIAIAAYGLLIPRNEGADGTVYGYSMWNTGGFPVALKRTFVVPSSEYPIRVKIIKVDYAQLNQTDMMEHTPHMYNRVLEDVHMDSGEKTRAWFYVGNNAFWIHRPLKPQIMDGDWLKFQRERYDRVIMNPPVEQQ